jgi:hypothetical protein
MASPLGVWLDAKRLTQTDLSLIANCDRADISRVVTGHSRARGRLRAYLTDKAPTVLDAQDRYHEVRRKELTATLEAA